MAGPAGRTGAAGPQGAIGRTGAQGPGGPAGSWTSFRDFWFASNRSDLQSSDSGKVSDIANYLSRNPGQQVGIDGSIDRSNTNLSNRRVSTVRDALLQAGVPSYRIQTGAFGDPQLQRDGRVEVLVSNRQQRLKQEVPGPGSGSFVPGLVTSPDEPPRNPGGFMCGSAQSPLRER